MAKKVKSPPSDARFVATQHPKLVAHREPDYVWLEKGGELVQVPKPRSGFHFKDSMYPPEGETLTVEEAEELREHFAFGSLFTEWTKPEPIVVPKPVTELTDDELVAEIERRKAPASATDTSSADGPSVADVPSAPEPSDDAPSTDDDEQEITEILTVGEGDLTGAFEILTGNGVDAAQLVNQDGSPSITRIHKEAKALGLAFPNL